MVRSASILVLITAVFAETDGGIPARAYRDVLLEAGHFCQTFCLAATSLGLASFCTGALADSIIEEDLRARRRYGVRHLRVRRWHPSPGGTLGAMARRHERSRGAAPRSRSEGLIGVRPRRIVCAWPGQAARAPVLSACDTGIKVSSRKAKAYSDCASAFQIAGRIRSS